MDALRGLAAIVVLLAHSRDLFFPTGRAATEAANEAGVSLPSRVLREMPHGQITLGNEAVMIFFVLSGYLVGGSVLRAFRRNSFSWKGYVSRRLTRLWVVLLPALLLTVAVDSLGFHLFPEPTSIYAGPLGQAEVGHHIPETLTPTVFAGNAFFLQTILVPKLGTNTALWTLANEFWYYLIFPFLVLALWPRIGIPIRLGSLFAACALLFFVGQPIALLFLFWLLGALIALLPLRLPGRASRPLLVALAVLAVPVMVGVRQLSLNVSVAQAIVSVYFGLLLYVIVHRTERSGGGLYARIATFLSDLSYPLYLTHLPLLIFLCAVFNRPWQPWTRTPAHLVTFLLLELAAIAVGYSFHLAFQRHTDAVRNFVVTGIKSTVYSSANG